MMGYNRLFLVVQGIAAKMNVVTVDSQSKSSITKRGLRSVVSCGRWLDLHRDDPPALILTWHMQHIVCSNLTFEHLSQLLISNHVSRNLFPQLTPHYNFNQSHL